MYIRVSTWLFSPHILTNDGCHQAVPISSVYFSYLHAHFYCRTKKRPMLTQLCTESRIFFLDTYRKTKPAKKHISIFPDPFQLTRNTGLRQSCNCSFVIYNISYGSANREYQVLSLGRKLIDISLVWGRI